MVRALRLLPRRLRVGDGLLSLLEQVSSTVRQTKYGINESKTDWSAIAILNDSVCCRCASRFLRSRSSSDAASEPSASATRCIAHSLSCLCSSYLQSREERSGRGEW